MKRFNYIPAPSMFDLHNACAIIAQAYPDSGVFLVGSSIQRLISATWTCAVCSLTRCSTQCPERP